MPPAKAKRKEDDIENNFKDIEKNFKSIVKEPEQFLTEQTEKYDRITNLLQQIYGVTIKNDVTNRQRMEVLPELILEGMDEEQIWQQLELRNDLVMPQFVENTAKMLAMREERFEIRLREGEEADEEQSTDEDEEENVGAEIETRDSEDDDDDQEDEEENLFETKRRKNKNSKTFRKTEVDDKFFKLGEMEAFLEAEEAKEMHKQKRNKSVHDNDDGIDYFAENLGDAYDENSDEDDDEEDEDEKEGNANYKDFFDEDDMAEHTANVESNEQDSDNEVKEGKDHFAEESDKEEAEDEAHKEENEEDSESAEEEDESTLPQRENNQNPFGANVQTDSDDDSEDESNNQRQAEKEQPKSSFEIRQARLEQRIRDYEEDVLGEKPWQLKGEVQAGNRPQNSLLEEILEFESTVRPAPIITEETTRCLEDIIKQRIKDQAWDDVERVVRAVNTPQDYRKLLVLDQEKSKESLAQVYEKEYQRELDKLDPSRADGTAAEQEPKEHTEIRNMMSSLFIKLDALSNFHFTPKPVAPETKIITNTPAVALEEVAPVAVSDAKLLAPEEVYRGPKNGLLGKSERTRTDKNRERRKKKQKQRAIHKALEVKDIQRQKMGIPLTKKEESAKLLKSITKHRNVEKITSSNDQGSLKSSKAFFSKLQDTTNSVNAKAAKRKPDAKMHTAKKLKL